MKDDSPGRGADASLGWYERPRTDRPPRELAVSTRAVCAESTGAVRSTASPFTARSAISVGRRNASHPRVPGADSERGIVHQNQDTVTPVHVAEPHKRLMAAVLRAVVDDCRAGTPYRRSAGYAEIDVRHVRRALAYVASTDRDWPFSFENLCEALDMDANTLRDRLSTPRTLA